MNMSNLLKPNKVRRSKDGKTITQKSNVWKSESTIRRVNNHLNKLALKGEVVPLRKEKNMLMLSVPKENAIYSLTLDDKGFIKKVLRF